MVESSDRPIDDELIDALLGTDPASLVFAYDPPMISADGSRIELPYRVVRTGDGAELAFTESLTLPPLPDGVDAAPVGEAFRRTVSLLSLVAGLSYYKALVPATMQVARGLTAPERDFLARVVRGGLAEFAYRNDLPAALRPTIDAPELPDPPAAPGRQAGTGAPGTPADPRRALVAVGGGKDSIVTLEAVRTVADEVRLFSVNEYAPITRTAEHAGLPLDIARRRIDPALMALNRAGAHNGHVPVTAINSLIGVLTALRAGLDTVVFANEASSSYGNVLWEGVEVNHQWSKSLGFEGLLRDLLAAAGTGVDYVSFLRPLTELAIMRRFGELRDYHSVFTSCNRAFHLDPTLRRSWCGECPKCQFVFLMLAPFVPREGLLAIFGRDLFDPATGADNTAGFLDLLAVGSGHKPFECVGEPSETRAALTLLHERREELGWGSIPFLERPEVAAVRVGPAEIEELFAFSPEHFLSGDLEKAARAVL